MSTRRQFLTQVAATGSVLALAPATGCARQNKEKPAPGKGGGGGPAAPIPAGGRARVVLVQSKDAVGQDLQVRSEVVRRMLEAGLGALDSDGGDPRKVLGSLMRPVDTVGLKVNCLAGRQMSTHVALVEQLVGLLEAAGLPRQQALVFDRSDDDLRRGGFELRSSGKDYRCMGNDSAGYEEELALMPHGASRCAVAATRRASVLINLPVLKDHGIAGLSGALKNNFGLVHNPNKLHLNGCDPHVAEVNALPFVRRKQKLGLCDALRVQLDGGPAFHAAGAVTHGALLLGRDPVALDTVSWELLEALRKERGYKSLAAEKRAPGYLLTAAREGLGVGDRIRIDLVRISV